MGAKRKELDVRLRDLAARHEVLERTVHRLATHTAVLAVAVRDPEAVPSADLDVALAGIADITTTLHSQPSD
jgi:hypothetical protein